MTTHRPELLRERMRQTSAEAAVGRLVSVHVTAGRPAAAEDAQP